MRVAIFDEIQPPMPASLPLRMTQTSSQRPAALLLAFVVPLALLATFLALGLVLEATLAPEARILLVRQPALGLEVAHHVRTSLSGTRHELILVHPEQEKSILLCVAPRTSQSEVDCVAALIGHKPIPPGELYRFNGLRPRTANQSFSDVAHA